MNTFLFTDVAGEHVLLRSGDFAPIERLLEELTADRAFTAGLLTDALHMALDWGSERGVSALRPGRVVPVGLNAAKILAAWAIEDGPKDPGLQVRDCAAEAEAAHDRRMERWARDYDELNGAPEGDEDR